MSSTTLVGLFDGYMSAARNGLTSETKLGGCATYFPPLNEEEVEQIDRWTRCGVCGHRMFLVLQAFSPLPTAVGPHQRMMYVFGCNSASCSRQPSSSYCAFSRQVDEEDVAALHDDDDIDEEEEEEEEEQQPLTAEEMGPNALPPSFIFVDDEPLKTTITLTEAERAVLQKMEDGSANNTTTQAELEEMEKKIDLRNKKADYYYEVFRARMARAPTQVLRYHQRCRGDDGSATTSGKRARPLFMHPGKVRREHRVPSCSTCGAALVHEVQVMPTALYYLHVQHFNNKNNNNSPSVSGPANLADVEGGGGMDFGTLTLYSCGHSCAATYPGRLLQREYLLVESPPAENDDDDDDDGKKSGAKLTFHDFVDGASPASPTGDPQLVDSEQEEDDDDDDDDDGDSSGSDVE